MLGSYDYMHPQVHFSTQSTQILKTSFKVVPWLLILGMVLPSEIKERRSKSQQQESGRISIVDTPYIAKGECNRGW